MGYFICRRAFRDAKGPIPVGTVVKETDIKRFRYRCNEMHIVEVTESTYASWANFFRNKCGIDIPKVTVPKKPTTKPVAKTKTVATVK